MRGCAVAGAAFSCKANQTKSLVRQEPNWLLKVVEKRLELTGKHSRETP